MSFSSQPPQKFLTKRIAPSARFMAARKNGEILTMGGLQYKVDRTKTGTESVTNDLGVNFLVAYPENSPEHFGFQSDGREWDYYPSLNHTFVDFDIDNDFMVRFPNQLGGWILRGHNPCDIFLGTGQSNEAAGLATGGDTPENPRVLAWNSEYNIPGNNVVIAQAGVRPFGPNNPTLQMAREIALHEKGLKVVFVTAKGNTALIHWLVNNGLELDMYAPILSEHAAFFAWAGIDAFPFRAICLTQGGADQNLSSMSFAPRASTNDDLNSWPGGVVEFMDRLRGDRLADSKTIFILGEASSTSEADGFNTGCGFLEINQKYPNLFVTNNRHFETVDGSHFTGPSITEIGKQRARILLYPDAYDYEPKIDRECELPVSEYNSNFKFAYQYLMKFDFLDEAKVFVEFDGPFNVASAIELHGLSMDKTEKIFIRGGLTSSKKCPVPGDFTGVESADRITVETLYQNNIYSVGKAFDVVGCWLNIVEAGIFSDATANGRDLISVRDGGFGFDSATLFGANTSGSSNLFAVNSIIKELGISNDGDGNSSTCIAYGRGVDNVVFKKGGGLGALNCSVLMPSTYITQMQLDAIITINTESDFKDMIIDATQNGLDLRRFSEAITTNISVTSVGASIVADATSEYG